MDSSNYSQKQLEKLKEKAEDFVRLHNMSQGMAAVDYFYRNKPASHFDDILQNKQGQMVPYVKDSGGDPRCPINGRLNGLFFSANNGRSSNPNTPPSVSPFGDTRLVMPSGRILASRGINLYFADFYCLKDHYVTLVVTKTRSKADDFCSLRLEALDIKDNEFIYVDKDHNVKVCNKLHLWIELFYTETVNVQLETKVYGAEVIRGFCTIGRGSSRLQGMTKKGCSHCRI